MPDFKPRSVVPGSARAPHSLAIRGDYSKGHEGIHTQDEIKLALARGLNLASGQLLDASARAERYVEETPGFFSGMFGDGQALPENNTANNRNNARYAIH